MSAIWSSGLSAMCMEKRPGLQKFVGVSCQGSTVAKC